jgi:hypothetical protein
MEKKNKLEGFLILLCIAFLSIALIIKNWYFVIPAFIVQSIITIVNKERNKIIRFLSYITVEIIFALLIWGIFKLIFWILTLFH